MSEPSLIRVIEECFGLARVSFGSFATGTSYRAETQRLVAIPTLTPAGGRSSGQYVAKFSRQSRIHKSERLWERPVKPLPSSCQPLTEGSPLSELARPHTGMVDMYSQLSRALSQTPLGDDGLTPPLGKPERFGDSDIRGISDFQRKVLVRIHQVGDPHIIGTRQVNGRDVPIGRRRAGRLLTDSWSLGRSRVTVFHTTSRSISK